MSCRHRSPDSSNASNKLRLDSLNKILKIEVGKSLRKQRKGSIAKQVSTIALSELLKDAPSRLQNIPDFKVFLSNEENVQLFRDFLKTQYCHENLDFYIACEKYRNLDPDKVGKELIKFMANQIYNDYLAENARQAINVDNSCRLSIASQMKNPGPDLLIEAQTEIFNLMRADCYPRFCKTWQLDKETARKILCERAIETPLNRKKTRINDSSSTAMSSTRCDITTTSLNDSCISDKKLSHHSYIECPSYCPYQRIGLPCQQHKISEGENISGQTEYLEKTNLKPAHSVPKSVLMRSPPPPPLPPKPRRYQTRSSPVDDPEFHPYVGKVFHV